MTPHLLLLPLLLLPLLLNAAPTRTLESLFSHRAYVTVNEPGPHALQLTGDLLAQCRSDWGDLRLVDERGAQVPYWLDMGNIRPAPQTSVEQPTLKAVSRRQLKADGALSTFEEILTLTEPTDPQSHWALEVSTPADTFVAELEWAWIDKGRREPPHTVSLFRLADGRAQTRFDVGESKGEALHVVVRGENGRFLEPNFQYVRKTSANTPELMPLPPVTLVTSSDEGVSKVLISRREGWREMELRFTTTTPAFSRRVRIYDVQDGQPKVLIGGGVISRLPRLPPNVEPLTIRLAPARGKNLQVEIDDGDSPGLTDLKIASYAIAPRLLFYAAPEHVGSQKLKLLVGSRSVARPVYDVTQLDERQVGAQFAEAIDAQLHPLSSNPAHDDTPLLRYAWTPGAVVQTGAYSHQAPLQITSAPEGVTWLTLPVDVVAHARSDLADVRIIDTQSRQIPYVRFASAVAPEWVPLTVAAPVKEGAHTLLALKGTDGPVAWDRLRLQVQSQYVERSFTVQGRATSADPWVTLASGTLSRAHDSAAPLDIALRAMPVSELRLVLKEGDAAPLELLSAEAEVSLPVLHVLAPPGDYRLLVGQPEATAPSYQLESLREVVSQLDAPKLQLAGALVTNPEFTRLSRLRQGNLPERIAVWGALGLGVLVLGAFTLRLLRKAPAGE